jgi:hypothetical protein
MSQLRKSSSAASLCRECEAQGEDTVQWFSRRVPAMEPEVGQLTPVVMCCIAAGIPAGYRLWANGVP